MKYRVERKEVYLVTYLVEAINEKMAKEFIDEGDGDEIDCHYYCNLSDYDVDEELTELKAFPDEEII